MRFHATDRTGHNGMPGSEALVFLAVLVVLTFGAGTPAFGQATQEDELPKFVQSDPARGTFEERMQTRISLDVRDMSVIDIIRFLALKGDLNIVTASGVQGRATFYLKSVTIKEALDIAAISNRLAYVVENDIIRVMSESEYEGLYGKSFSDRRQVEIVQLTYAKPKYAMSALDGIKSKIGQIIIDEETGSVVLIDTPESLAEMKKTLKEIESPRQVHIYELRYAKADVVAERLRQRLDANTVGEVAVDTRTNKLIIRSLSGRWPEVQKIIASLDAPTREVLVEARILQVVFKPQMDYGIDWALDFRNSNYSALRKLSVKSVMLDEDNLSSSSNLFSKYGRMAFGNFDVNQFETAIRALKQVENTKILSNPKILVTNNEEAKIHVGDTVPYIISTTSGTGDNAITSEDVRFVDVGLKLNVTPTINPDGMVTMVLQPEISTVVGKITSNGGGIPQVNKTLVETTVMVQDGMTIVLGGLKKENKAQTVRGIPVLMDLPLLGKLFSSKSDSLEATEIVIFITPHIISGDKAYHTDEIKGTIKPPKVYDLPAETDGKPQGPALQLKS